MNYRKLYIRIIKNSLLETKNGLRPMNKKERKKYNKYFEFHHILPRSLFPLWIKRESNIVALSAREHFFCHQLLEKIYPNSNMFLGTWRMANDHKHKVTSREYERLKIRALKVFKENGKKLAIATWSNPEFRKRASARRTELNIKRKGVFKHSEEAKKKIRESCLGKKMPEEIKNKISESNSKKIICLETGEIFNGAKSCAIRYNKKVVSIYKAVEGFHRYILCDGKKIHLSFQEAV